MIPFNCHLRLSLYILPLWALQCFARGPPGIIPPETFRAEEWYPSNLPTVMPPWKVRGANISEFQTTELPQEVTTSGLTDVTTTNSSSIEVTESPIFLNESDISDQSISNSSEIEVQLNLTDATTEISLEFTSESREFSSSELQFISADDVTKSATIATTIATTAQPEIVTETTTTELTDSTTSLGDSTGENSTEVIELSTVASTSEETSSQDPIPRTETTPSTTIGTTTEETTTLTESTTPTTTPATTSVTTSTTTTAEPIISTQVVPSDIPQEEQDEFLFRGSETLFELPKTNGISKMRIKGSSAERFSSSRANTTKTMLSTTTTVPFVENKCPDILFVIDSSGNVKAQYEKQKELIKFIMLGLGTQHQQTGLLTYASQRRQRWNIPTRLNVTKELFLRKLQIARFLGGVTATGAVLVTVKNQLEESGRPTKVVVLTDGFSFDLVDEPARQLRALPGVEVFVTGDYFPVVKEVLNSVAGSSANVRFGHRAIRRLIEDLRCPTTSL